MDKGTILLRGILRTKLILCPRVEPWELDSFLFDLSWYAHGEEGVLPPEFDSLLDKLLPHFQHTGPATKLDQPVSAQPKLRDDITLVGIGFDTSNSA